MRACRIPVSTPTVTYDCKHRSHEKNRQFSNKKNATEIVLQIYSYG